MAGLNESALLAAAEAMRDAEIGYSINLTRLVDGVAEHTATLPDGNTHVFPTSAAASEFVERERNLAKAKAAVEAYLEGMGGILCHRDPAAWYAEDSLGCEYFTLDIRQAEQWRATYDVFGLHMPLSVAGKGDDGWIEIQDAPKDCLIAAICWHPPFGSYEGKWVGPEFYAWNENMKYWDNKQRGTCIWPQYHDRYRCRSLGPLPTPPSIPSDEGSEKP